MGNVSHTSWQLYFFFILQPNMRLEPRMHGLYIHAFDDNANERLMETFLSPSFDIKKYVFFLMLRSSVDDIFGARGVTSCYLCDSKCTCCTNKRNVFVFCLVVPPLGFDLFWIVEWCRSTHRVQSTHTHTHTAHSKWLVDCVVEYAALVRSFAHAFIWWNLIFSILLFDWLRHTTQPGQAENIPFNGDFALTLRT